MEIAAVAGLIVAGYFCVGCVLTFLLWRDADYARWSFKMTVVALVVSPLALVEYVLDAVVRRVVKS